MRVLFAIGHAGFLRNFESGLRALIQAGHDVRVLVDTSVDAASVTGSALQVIERLGGLDGSFTHFYDERASRSPWSALGAELRMARDYWRYLATDYDAAPLLRARAGADAPAFARGLARWAPRLFLRGADAAVHALECRLPVPDGMCDLLREQRPDVVVVTPLVYFRSDQVVLLRAARQCGIPSVYATGSWDHLTSKGLVHDTPDAVLTWNASQIDECVQLHGLPRARCVATGAQAFDHWFDYRPVTTRPAFCADAGLPADGPILLYLCSSTFIAGDERGFVRDWLAAIRTSRHPALARAGVLIRPHPQNAAQWKDEHFDDGLTVVWPRAGANPVGDAARADFYHSIYFSAAVVGVNTSAQIESAVVGRPVFSVLSERYSGTQSGTLHFRHLRGSGGGLLHEASSLPQHCAQLADALDGRIDASAQSARFVESFVRPHGRDRNAGEVFAGCVADAAAAGPLSGARKPLSRAVLAWLAPLEVAASAAGRFRATSEPLRFQSWFLAGPPVAPAHLGGLTGRRTLCVVSSRPEADALLRLVPQLIEPGGRVVAVAAAESDTARALRSPGAKAMRLTAVGLWPRRDVWGTALALWTSVAGWPPLWLRRALPPAPQATLLVRKFRPDAVVYFHGADRSFPVADVLEAARAAAIPVRAVADDQVP